MLLIKLVKDKRKILTPDSCKVPQNAPTAQATALNEHFLAGLGSASIKEFLLGGLLLKRD